MVPARAVCVLLALFSVAGAERKTIPVEDASAGKSMKVRAESANHRGRKALRVADSGDANEDRLWIVSGTEFHDGTIEVDLSGEPGPGASEQARGFVGVAFRAAPDGSRFECIYLRPTNGRAEDQVRRNHSIQYISFPQFPWQRLRKEFPEKYESYVDLAPGEWTKVRIEVTGKRARLYVHEAQQPALIVNDLKLGDTKGAIALWIGPGTVAHFSNLRITQ